MIAPRYQCFTCGDQFGLVIDAESAQQANEAIAEHLSEFPTHEVILCVIWHPVDTGA